MYARPVRTTAWIPGLGPPIDTSRLEPPEIRNGADKCRTRRKTNTLPLSFHVDSINRQYLDTWRVREVSSTRLRAYETKIICQFFPINY